MGWSLLDESEQEFFNRMQMNAAREHRDHVEGARYDDVRERHAAEIEDMRQNDLSEQYFHDECVRAQALGMLETDDTGMPDLTEYYNYLIRLDEYSTRQYE